MKRLITKIWVTLLAVLFVANVYAQKGYVISGEIKDGTTGELLVGATVQIKGTMNASATNAKGFFELKTAAELPFVLVFSFLGYETQEFEVKDLQQPISIALNTQP
ncbi:MAG: carboxypeptidase-like regulatory domain-containing protein, partial [Cytophagales bacterium]|nr:carboxypeptidase-like regulatory domain-containing protein [Cytophagales bacterium]